MNTKKNVLGRSISFMKYAECTLTSNENEGGTLGDAMTKSGNRNIISKDCHKNIIMEKPLWRIGLVHSRSISFNLVLKPF